MQRTTLARTLLALFAVALLTLAGCGGDDGVSQSVHDMALVELDAAQMAAAEAEAQAAAEAAAKAEAEAAAAQAASDKAAADAAAAAAEALQMEAEADQAAAEAKAAEAEAAAQMAQDAAAEAAMTAKEAADLLAEVREDLAAAEQARMEAEMGQTAAETGQTAAEMERDALAAADTATRAASIIGSMQAFISDADMDNAARLTEFDDSLADLGVSATDFDYDPADVTDAMRDDDTGGPLLDMTMYGDEGVAAEGLDADVSVGQKNRPSGVNTPGLGGVSLKYANGEITATASPPRGDEFAVVGYEAQDAEPPAIAGWDGGVLMRRDDVDNADQMLYYYTDIADVTGVSFLQKYRGTSVRVTNGTITRASSLTFPNVAASGDLNLVGDDPTTPDAVEPGNHVAFAGTFDGVEGVFECTGNCSVVYNSANGSVSLLFGAPPADDTAVDGRTTTPGGTDDFLTFTPDDFTDSVMGIGNEHLVFGYWLHKPSNPAAAHHFMPFAGGMAAYDVRGDNPATTPVERDDATRSPAANGRTPEVSLVHRLTGTARFKGPAAGKYVTREVLGQSAMIGQFTATAELLADFDAGAIPAASTIADPTQRPGRVTGVVQDFMDANGDALSNWHVTLGSANLDAIGATPGINEGPDRLDPTTETVLNEWADNSFNGRTEAGMSITQFNGATNARLGGAAIAGTGRWVGQFYGPGRSDGNPNAIVGVFDAHAGHASISGAFGSYNTAQ